MHTGTQAYIHTCTHAHMHTCIHLFALFCQDVCLSVHVPAFLYPPVNLSLPPCVCLSKSVCPFVYLSVFTSQSIPPSMCLSVHSSVHTSVFLSLSVCPYACIHVDVHTPVALSTNIKLGCKSLPGTKTLTFYENLQNYDHKKFYSTGPRSGLPCGAHHRLGAGGQLVPVSHLVSML
jgi:hypothetical protein